ncbi:hypothetical protein [Edwardsiella ictaluri]|uniref:hypothetical protein n=1 Tax=Edwardsiella ictaluri TaxID=67780 RepID=UPI0039F73603
MPKNYVVAPPIAEQPAAPATDFHAFIEWLWSIDASLGVKVQELHDLWRHKLARHNQQCTLQANEFIIDGRYRVRINPPDSVERPAGLKLTSLMETGGVIAIYQTSGALVADLIAHSTSRSGHQVSARRYAPEAARLLDACRQAWLQNVGMEP